MTTLYRSILSRYFVAFLLLGGCELSAQTISFTTLNEPGSTISLTLSYEGELALSGVKEHYASSDEPHTYTLLGQEVVITGAIQTMRVSKAGLTTLTLSECAALIELDCSQNNLTTLDVSQAPALQKLSCFANRLTQITFPRQSSLTQLKCTNNQLTVLDVSSLTELNELTCSNNELTQLDVTTLTHLKVLKCYQNKLEALDLSSCTLLEKLWCSGNDLHGLDLSTNPQLQVVWCYDNQISRLLSADLSKLLWLYCEGNDIESLDCSRMPRLSKLSIYGNKIRDNAMAALVASLPEREAPLGNLIVVNTRDTEEENVCTKACAAQATAKGWQVLDYYGGANGHQGVSYGGCDTAIEAVDPSSDIQVHWVGDDLLLSNLSVDSVVVIYNILGQQLHTALSPHLGELLIEILEYDGGPLILTIDDLRVAKLYHP